MIRFPFRTVVITRPRLEPTYPAGHPSNCVPDGHCWHAPGKPRGWERVGRGGCESVGNRLPSGVELFSRLADQPGRTGGADKRRGFPTRRAGPGPCRVARNPSWVTPSSGSTARRCTGGGGGGPRRGGTPPPPAPGPRGGAVV